MSLFVGIMFMIIGFVALVMKKKYQSEAQQPTYERNPTEEQRPPQTKPYYRVEIPARQAPNQVRSQGQQQSRMRSGGTQQSAWDWMHDQNQDPEGETLMYRGIEEDWIRPVEPTVKNDLSDLQESRHETVHATVRDTIHVRHNRGEAVMQPTRSQQGTLSINKSQVRQALILGEVLGEPRSKRPWKPNRNR